MRQRRTFYSRVRFLKAACVNQPCWRADLERNFVAFPALQHSDLQMGQRCRCDPIVNDCRHYDSRFQPRSRKLNRRRPGFFEQNLKSPSEFRSITNQEDRSRAIFTELGKTAELIRDDELSSRGEIHRLQGAELSQALAASVARRGWRRGSWRESRDAPSTRKAISRYTKPRLSIGFPVIRDGSSRLCR